MGVGVLLQNDVLFEQNCVYVRQASATAKKGGSPPTAHPWKSLGFVWRNLVSTGSSISQEAVQSRCQLLLQLISIGLLDLHGIGPER